MKEQDLLNLKKKVEESKQKVSELRGHQNALMKQLKDDWKCKSVENAEKKLKSMKTEIERLDESIEEGIKEIEEKYDV